MAEEDNPDSEINPFYSNSLVLWELAKQLQFRYLSLRKYHDGKVLLVRNLLGYKPDFIKQSIENYGGFRFNTKLYFDLATWKETPMFSFDPEKRAMQKNDFNQTWQDKIASYDFAIDLDAPDKNPKTAWKDAAEIKNFFDQEQIPYSIKFSGTKGFHFLIEAKYLPKRIKAINMPRHCGQMAEWLVNRFNCQSVDTSIYDHRRILKLAYSTDGHYVCLPLTDHQFNNFDLHDMRMIAVWKKIKIYNRGLLTRTHDCTDKQLKLNVQKMFRKK